MLNFKVPAIFTAVDRLTGPMKAMSTSSMTLAARLQTVGAIGQRAFRKIGTVADSAFSKMVNFRNAAGALIAGLAARKIYDGVTGIAKMGDEAAKTSRLIGMSAESLQELRFAADRSGIGNEALSTSLQKLNKNVGDLQAGSGMLRTLLDRTNPSLSAQLKLVNNNEQAFGLMVQAIQDAPNDLAKASLAQAAFGRSGMEMLNLIAEGPEGIAALRAEARKYGGVLSNEAAAASEKFIDSQTNMNFALDGLKVMIGTQLMPKVQSVIEKITNWTMTNRELIKANIAAWTDRVGAGIAFVRDNADKLILGAKILIGTLATLKAVSIASRVAILGIGIAKGIVTAATWAYNFATGASVAINKKNIFTLRSSQTAMLGYKVAQGLATAATWVAAAATGAWAAAMNAGIWPIVAIAAAVTGLIALVATIINKWDSWGAAVSLFLGPLGFVISLVQSFRQHWDSLVTAFQAGGIIAGLKRIGFVILDALLAPVQSLLDLLAKIPGMGDLAGGGAAFIQGMRDNLDTATAINPEADRQQAQSEIIKETIQRSQLDINIRDQSNGRSEVKSRGITPTVAPTFAF